MEVHRQTCQACGSRELMNVLVREPGKPQVVYASCRKCNQLVARYQLESYYHHGKGSESWLRSRGSAAEESGRRMLRLFEAAKEEAVSGFERAMRELEESGKEV